MATEKNDSEPEVIELIEEVMSNQMFLAALAVGAVLGGILFYLYMQSKNNGGFSLNMGNAPQQLPEPEMLDAVDDGEAQDTPPSAVPYPGYTPGQIA